MLYNIDKRLREIMHMPTRPFGNLDVIFCGDLCQAQPVRDFWIFEQPRFQQQPFPYKFWPDMIKCYEPKKVVRQENQTFISILNRIRTCSQTIDDIDYLNQHCYRKTPIDATFPYLFHCNKDVQEHN